MAWEKEAGIQKLARFCAYQERARTELLQKLRKLECPEEEWDEMVEEMERMNFWNEERFARSFVRGKFRQKGWGKVKIRQALYMKGVEDGLIQVALDEEISMEAYRERAREELEKKAMGKDLSDPAQRNKVYTSLVARGYEQGLVIELMKGENQ